MTFPPRKAPPIASDVGYQDPDENAQFDDAPIAPKRSPFPPKKGAKGGKPVKGKKKFVLKKKAKKPAIPPRRPVMEPMPPEDGGY